jgi:hypothetical protein
MVEGAPVGGREILLYHENARGATAGAEVAAGPHGFFRNRYDAGRGLEAFSFSVDHGERILRSAF